MNERIFIIEKPNQTPLYSNNKRKYLMYIGNLNLILKFCRCYSYIMCRIHAIYLRIFEFNTKISSDILHYKRRYQLLILRT